MGSIKCIHTVVCDITVYRSVIVHRLCHRACKTYKNRVQNQSLGARRRLNWNRFNFSAPVRVRHSTDIRQEIDPLGCFALNGTCFRAFSNGPRKNRVAVSRNATRRNTGNRKITTRVHFTVVRVCDVFWTGARPARIADNTDARRTTIIFYSTGFPPPPPRSNYQYTLLGTETISLPVLLNGKYFFPPGRNQRRRLG